MDEIRFYVSFNSIILCHVVHDGVSSAEYKNLAAGKAFSISHAKLSVAALMYSKPELESKKGWKLKIS